MSETDLASLLGGDEPQEVLREDDGSFDPKFNVREEFPLWIRDQFPELMMHANKKRVYEALESRKEEVFEAALGALTHGVNSTDACARSRLYGGWSAMQKGFRKGAHRKNRSRNLAKFVEAIEDLSISLGGDSHYTQAGKIIGGHVPGQRFEAFVYRVGDENGEKTFYLVSEDLIEWDETFDPRPELIGELDDLSKWELEKLYRDGERFVGPEKEFVEEMDRVAPETGAYSSGGNFSGGGYSGYGGGQARSFGAQGTGGIAGSHLVGSKSGSSGGTTLKQTGPIHYEIVENEAGDITEEDREVVNWWEGKN